MRLFGRGVPRRRARAASPVESHVALNWQRFSVKITHRIDDASISSLCSCTASRGATPLPKSCRSAASAVPPPPLHDVGGIWFFFFVLYSLAFVFPLPLTPELRSVRRRHWPHDGDRGPKARPHTRRPLSGSQRRGVLGTKTDKVTPVRP
jgi:hypothetical protein